MYCGALGKTANCQVGVSVHAVTDWASAALDWRLFLPESWDDHKAGTPDQADEVRRRRQRCAIPEDQRHREKWRLALDMIDELAEWGFAGRTRRVLRPAGTGEARTCRVRRKSAELGKFGGRARGWVGRAVGVGVRVMALMRSSPLRNR